MLRLLLYLHMPFCILIFQLILGIVGPCDVDVQDITCSGTRVRIVRQK